eukprot:2257619-Amphidinium_carterae.2
MEITAAALSIQQHDNTNTPALQIGMGIGFGTQSRKLSDASEIFKPTGCKFLVQLLAVLHAVIQSFRQGG